MPSLRRLALRALVMIVAGVAPPSCVPSSMHGGRADLPRRLVVDALDHGGVAALEDPTGERWSVPRARLPAGVREGDVLRVIVREDRVSFALDGGATDGRRRALEERYGRLPRATARDLAR